MYHYTECGLDNVWLRNGYEITETRYGEAVAFHDVDGLHRAIGMDMVCNSPALTGAEIRFLRKEMDLSQSHLARILGATEPTVRGWEAGRTQISKPAERMLRTLYLEHVGGDGSVRDLLERLSEMNREIHRRRLELTEVGGGWRSAA